MKKKNIIQFMPYFSPHIGGVEKVGEDIFLKWTHGESIVFSGEIKDDIYVYNGEGVQKIETKRYFGFPVFDIVDNFPIPLIWTKKYKNNIKKLTKIIKGSPEENFYIITHTRFFLSSFLGGRFAKRNNIKWIHIEHGSDYVKLSSKFKNKIAYFYDRTIGNYIFRKADTVLAISNAAEDFIQEEFSQQDTQVWYRGIDMPKACDKQGDIKIVFVGRLVSLKGVDILLRAYNQSGIENDLIIFGDGEERKKLEKLSIELNIGNKVRFKGFVESTKVIEFLSTHHCIMVNPSYQEGMPTTVIEGLATKNIVIASDVGGTSEISKQEDLVLFRSGGEDTLSKKIQECSNEYFTLAGKSYNHIYEKFSWEKNLKDLYNSMK